jgi:hypothetical protein
VPIRRCVVIALRLGHGRGALEGDYAELHDPVGVTFLAEIAAEARTSYFGVEVAVTFVGVDVTLEVEWYQKVVDDIL